VTTMERERKARTTSAQGLAELRREFEAAWAVEFRCRTDETVGPAVERTGTIADRILALPGVDLGTVAAKARVYLWAIAEGPDKTTYEATDSSSEQRALFAVVNDLLHLDRNNSPTRTANKPDIDMPGRMSEREPRDHFADESLEEVMLRAWERVTALEMACKGARAMSEIHGLDPNPQELKALEELAWDVRRYNESAVAKRESGLLAP